MGLEFCLIGPSLTGGNLPDLRYTFKMTSIVVANKKLNKVALTFWDTTPDKQDKNLQRGDKPHED